MPDAIDIGMKLECDDKGNDAVCCATVGDIHGDQLCIHFDGWERCYDIWTYPWDPCLKPVGWCQENGVALSTPKGNVNNVNI